MEHEKIQTSIQAYIEKYKELETAKTELVTQRDQISNQLSNVDKNMIFLQGSIRALQELMETSTPLEPEQKETKEKK